MLAAGVIGTVEDERCKRHEERATDKGFQAGNQTLQSTTEVPGPEIDFIVCLLSRWLPKTPSKDWAIP